MSMLYLLGIFPSFQCHRLIYEANVSFHKSINRIITDVRLFN